MRDYLNAEGDALDRKRVQLAATVAGLFDEYTFTRPEMLAAWRAGQTVGDVDPALAGLAARAVAGLARAGRVLAARGAMTLPELFAQTPESQLRAPAAHLFGISYVARLYGPIFGKLAKVTDLWVYSLSPNNLDRLDEPEGGALDAWARPGRENAALLLDLAAGDADARFVDPAGRTAARWRRCSGGCWSARRRPTAPIAADDTLVIQPAPDAAARAGDDRGGRSGRRCATTRAARSPTSRWWCRPAAAATYLPLAREVFDAASRLPCTVLDLPRAGRAADFRGGDRAAGVAAGSAGPPRRAAGGDAPGGRAAIPGGRSRGLAGAVRGPGDRARAPIGRGCRAPIWSATASAGTRGCAGWRWARSCRAARRRRGLRAGRRAAAARRPVAVGRSGGAGAGRCWRAS